MQLLKDFPAFQLWRGQVAHVKPSLMRNYLHAKNGARYIVDDMDIDHPLMRAYESRQEFAATEISSKAILNQATKQVTLQSPTTTEKPEPVRKSFLEEHADVTLDDVKIPGLHN